MDGLALVDEGRIARDHEEPPQLGQRRDDVLANAIGKIVLLRIPAHVDERKHGNRRPVRQRQGRARPLMGLIRRQTAGICRFGAGRLHAHLTDEAETLAGDGADQLLLRAAVADRVSCCIDAAGQGRI
jgi:hypothetical protein